MQHVLLTERSSNEDLTWMGWVFFFPFGRELLEVPETGTCSVGVLRCRADWDADQQVMGGVLERGLLAFADVGAEDNVS